MFTFEKFYDIIVKMFKKFFFIILTIVLISNFAADRATAQAENSSKLITDVKVENNKLVSTSTILSKIKTQIGSNFSQGALNEDIKDLYATGYFTDIKVDLKDYQGGVAVIFIVTEKPLVKEIVFKGNDKIRVERLRELVNIEVDQPLDRTQLKRDIEKIENLYIKEGYHLALVSEEIHVDKKTNEARIFILIDEGTRYRTKEVKVQGNSVISDKEILKSIKTKPDTLFTSGFFKKEIFREDLKRIKKLYADRGYSDARIDYNLDYDKKHKTMVITIKIDEGRKYTVGEINITGNNVVSRKEIEDAIEIHVGSTFIESQIHKNAININEIYFDRGYISAKVIADVVFNREKQNMDVTYNIDEGQQARIEKIEIRGNTKTKDIVIRRELKIAPGEVFNGEKLKKSRQKLNNLGYFEEVTYSTTPGSAPNKKNLIINVKETKTGEVSFGAGYSSIDKFIGFVELRQRNFDWRNFPAFTGDGQDLSIRAEFGSKRKYYDLSFTEPWVFNRPISFGFDLYNRYSQRDTYDEERLGGDIRLGRRFGDYLSLNGMYKLEKVNISDIESNADDAVKEEEGEHIISSLSLNLTRDTRDNVFNPTSGGVLRNTVQFAGGCLGGDRDFMKYTSMLDWYFTYFKNQTLEVKLQGGVVDEFGDTIMVPIYERFYAGGANTIRGYGYRDVGPESAAGDPIGGESMAVANFEYTFPIIKQIKGAVFYDVGNVWSKIDDFGSSFKSAVGVGVRVNTPLGPVKVDYGYGLDYEPGEKKGRFHFSMSRGF